MIAKHCLAKPNVKPVFNRPPLNRLSDTEYVKSAPEHEHFSEKSEEKPVLNRPPLNMLGDTLVIAKHFPVPTRAKTRTTWTTTRPDCVEIAWKNKI